MIDERAFESFVPTWPMWFIVDDPETKRITDDCSAVLRGGCTDENGKDRPLVPVFTDMDLACRFIERGGIRRRGTFMPFPCSKADFPSLLSQLKKSGDPELGIDPEGHSVNIVSIVSLLGESGSSS